jgi:type IV fimbrial biogenesis protein FimT
VLTYPKSLAGFTLIELMFAITIIGILVAAGFPEASRWLQNTKIRTASESISNGLQLARGEAVRRNTQVEFTLTSTVPIAANTPALAVATSGPFWVVRKFQTAGYTAADFVQGGGNEVTTTGAVVSSTDANVVFNGLERTDIVAANLTIQVTNPAGGTCVAASGPMRCLNVVVLPGGQIRMCDPSIATVGDTRKC